MTDDHVPPMRANVDDLVEGTPERDLGDLAWQSDNVVLVSVGIDIGSTTSHLLFSRLHLQRSSTSLTSRFHVVARETLHRSPILLTPYAADGTIDVDVLERFIGPAYGTAGLTRADVDTGAVILTGNALLRANSRRIADLFALDGGRFVCASAGHLLEATLAAHGSGAVALSRSGRAILNIDIGGGTTKFGLARDGTVIATLAIGVGARMLTLDPAGRILAIEPPARLIAADEGIDLEVGAILQPDERRRLGKRAAELIVRAGTGRLTAAERAKFVLDGDLKANWLDAVTLSGGVSEVFHGRVDPAFGDLAGEIATALADRMGDLDAPLEAPAEGIRATVIGASQFSVQVSGNTLHLSDPSVLPLRDLPVLPVQTSSVERADAAAICSDLVEARRQRSLDPSRTVVCAVRWAGDPEYTLLRSLADGIAAAHRTGEDAALLVVACQADIAATLGSILTDELAVPNVLVIDGLDLTEFDHIDIGTLSLPANVVPVVIKSLLFPVA